MSRRVFLQWTTTISSWLKAFSKLVQLFKVPFILLSNGPNPNPNKSMQFRTGIRILRQGCGGKTADRLREESGKAAKRLCGNKKTSWELRQDYSKTKGNAGALPGDAGNCSKSAARLLTKETPGICRQLPGTAAREVCATHSRELPGSAETAVFALFKHQTGAGSTFSASPWGKGVFSGEERANIRSIPCRILSIHCQGKACFQGCSLHAVP